MSTNHTPNYDLSQWEATDKVLRTDFNADNAKIDAALAGLDSAITSVSTGLTHKLGRYTRINSWKTNGTALVFGFSPPRVNWSEWESVCILVHYPETTADSSTRLCCCLGFDIDGSRADPKNIAPLALPGYLVVFLPCHREPVKTEGFIISDRFIPFSFDYSPNSLIQINYESVGERLSCPNIVCFGRK